MKKIAFFCLFTLVSFVGFSQPSISYHQSNLPFVGINYEIKERLKPELRLGTNYLFEDITVEIDISYDIANKEDYEIYVGGGFLTSDHTDGIVIPIGTAFYPFNEKKFGFHLELAPIIGDNNILRGSWGIRYRFLK
ncbi:hypothetical protein [Chondrinema litorale]|uniref:hypothetical protein n=1 Tax=Chondrinema litorale TaxID=2994555 RepID=UPI000C4C52E1|nr:hypothetical protein [Chondrinema litorale]MBT33970.1 hypothetical protein [Thalassovita sp.]UZR95345.1 hypothetical protein OQ292_05870 [Chondrinema litorale]